MSDNVRASVMLLGAVATALSMAVSGVLVLVGAAVTTGVLIGMYARWHA